MIREVKITFEQKKDYCNIYREMRTNYGEWEKQGATPMFGTLEKIRPMYLANEEKWGWTPYDQEEDGVYVFWKEF